MAALLNKTLQLLDELGRTRSQFVGIDHLERRLRVALDPGHSFRLYTPGGGLVEGAQGVGSVCSTEPLPTFLVRSPRDNADTEEAGEVAFDRVSTHSLESSLSAPERSDRLPDISVSASSDFAPSLKTCVGINVASPPAVRVRATTSLSFPPSGGSTIFKTISNEAGGFFDRVLYECAAVAIAKYG